MFVNGKNSRQPDLKINALYLPKCVDRSTDINYS